MKVIVIGGGAVGLSVAESLASRGAEVALFERDRCGEGASAGNAGWITPSLAIPVPGPGVIAESLRWLVNPSGPLWIRPTFEREMLSWIVRFALNCRRPKFRRALAALQRAAAEAGAAFDRLAERGVEFELHDDPLLYPAFDDAELGHLRGVMETLRASGSTQRLEQLSPRETLEAEPMLDPGVIGAIIAHGERRVRPELLTAGLESALRTMGAEIHEQAPVTRLIRDRATWIVETGASSHRAEAVVLANGVATTELLGKLGTSLPVVAAKGYSRTYSRDSANGSSAPRGALYLESPKVAISVFDGGVRLSGTLELGAKQLTRSNRRLTAIADAARKALSGWRMPEHPADWAGMRSLSPDGLPFIGAVPDVPAVHVATAHGTLGITLAPLTGELLAPLVLEGARNELTNAFDPARGQAHVTTGGLQ